MNSVYVSQRELTREQARRTLGTPRRPATSGGALDYAFCYSQLDSHVLLRALLLLQPRTGESMSERRR